MKQQLAHAMVIGIDDKEKAWRPARKKLCLPFNFSKVDHKSGAPSNQTGSCELDEAEVRQLLMDHVGHRYCSVSEPARKGQIVFLENFFAYVGTLETFIEERETVIEKEPYVSGLYAGEGLQYDIWELDVNADSPQMFVEKDLRFTLPHTEVVQLCDNCNGQGKIICPSCNGEQRTHCAKCSGIGLIAKQNRSLTRCKACSGKGTVYCDFCDTRAIVPCSTCNGSSMLVARSVAVVKWKTVSVQKASTTSIATDTPAEVLHKATGNQLYNMQAYQCNPAFFPYSNLFSSLSSEVIANRATVPPSARAITERHIISSIPVTRVIMAHQNHLFTFYVTGYDRQIFVWDYPSRFCRGLCCCFEWLNF
ncbi:chaperone protein dnaJ-like protein [Rhynchospora pubera]|uniref:Chaperone protein dnaJ-like protein n=1 Tax=Rhynchospora pubera TaxID=906938 RepID=A0AAV8ASZ9_9POAL|nr:chaperone protein dnaJ-like protein [Rhynchospora pubera]KAJ4752965.1 chaperone protein dnaJ-like protein [Rhynchospora pubera]